MDEYAIRGLIREVKAGRLSRRSFIRTMVGVGLTAPLASQMLAANGIAQAQTKPAPGFLPTKRGGGGRLRLLWWQAPTLLNGHFATGTKDEDACRPCYEPLCGFDPDGNFVPILAAEVPSLQNGGLAKDGRSVTWRLKKGVQWHDGKPFTADDVIFTWEYAADPATAAVSVTAYRDIERIDRIDDHTRVLRRPRLRHAQAPVQGLQGRQLPAGAAESQARRHRALSRRGLQAGRLRALRAQSELSHREPAILRRRRDEGRRRSHLRRARRAADRRVRLCVEPPGRVGSPAPSGAGRQGPAHQHPDREHRAHPAQPERSVDGRRRRAGQHEVQAPTVPGPEVPSGPLVSPKWEFSIDKANRLLDEAGYKRGGDGVRVGKDGKRVKLLFQTSTNSLRQKNQAIIKQACAKAGIEVELKSVTASVFFSSDAANPDTYGHFYADLQMYNTTMTSPDPQFFMNQFLSTEAAQKANHWAGRNPTRWRNEEYDRLWKAAEVELDAVKRAAMWIQMNDLVVNNVVVIPENWRNRSSAAAAKLRGLDLSGWDSTLWRIAYWYREA